MTMTTGLVTGPPAMPHESVTNASTRKNNLIAWRTFYHELLILLRTTKLWGHLIMDINVWGHIILYRLKLVHRNHSH